jgi:peptidoglycan/LPS O-acetylase OafA/YrhL
MSYKRFRDDINGLRAIAVIGVVLFHFSIPYVTGGFVGVDIFFVISGFLMTGIVLEKVDQKDILAFYIARFQRILPALLFMIICLFIFGFFSLGTEEYRNFANNALSSIFFFSNNFYAIHSGYFDPSSDTNYLLHTWSLSAEWQFYLLYPLIILSIRKLKLPLGLTLTAVVIISLSFCLFKTPFNKENAFYILPTRAWEMLSGGLVYIFSKKIKSYPWMKALNYIGITVLIFSFFIIPTGEYWPSVATLLPILGTCAVILANNNFSILTSNAFFQWLGKISYSLYIWHWPVIVIMRHYGLNLTLINAMIGIVISIVFAQISFSCVENVFRDKSVLFINFLCFFLVTISLSIIKVTDGFSFRFSETIKQIVEYKPDLSDWRQDTCFLAPEQDYASFNKCPDVMSSTSVVLWGDSHAAQLMPGLRRAFNKKLNITQRTASLCPPLIGQPNPGRPLCPSITKGIVSEILEKKPQIVILASLWTQYDLRSYLPDSLEMLEDAGVKRIYIIGSFPFWKDNLPKLIEKNGLSESGYISKDYLDKERDITGNDEYLKKIAKTHDNITFISAMDTICTDSSCKAIVFGAKRAPFQFDTAHMSPDGSTWFVDKIKDKIN